MGTKKDHKRRTQELEELSRQIEDTGNLIEVDEAELQRAVYGGQIAENVKWNNQMEGNAELKPASVLPHNASYQESLEEIRKHVEGLENAGYMPKTKPLLYYLDFLTMELNRIKEMIEREEDPEMVQKLTVLQWKAEAKVEMCIDWLKAQDTAGNWGSITLGPRGHEVNLPTFGSRAEVDEAIRTRHLPRHGETMEDLIAGRTKRYRDDSKRITDGIDRQNKMDEEAKEHADES